MDYDYEELAARILGMSEEEYETLVNDEDKSDYDELDVMLYDKFDVSLEGFIAIAKVLLPMTYPVEAAISGTLQHVFGEFNVRGFCAIVSEKSTLVKKK